MRISDIPVNVINIPDATPLETVMINAPIRSGVLTCASREPVTIEAPVRELAAAIESAFVLIPRDELPEVGVSTAGNGFVTALAQSNYQPQLRFSSEDGDKLGEWNRRIAYHNLAVALAVESHQNSDRERLAKRRDKLARDWYDDGADAWWAGEEILKIIDPGNSRLQPPPPPTEEEIAARREQERQWIERRRQEALDREAAMLARYQRGLGAILENWDIDERGIATRKKTSG